MNVTIRNARPSDAEAIIKMHRQSWLDTYPNEQNGVSAEWVNNRTSKWFEDEKKTARVDRVRQASIDTDLAYKIAVTDEGEIVGFASPIRSETEQRVGGIYVAKEFQGTGVAHRLMNEILKWSDLDRPLELEVAVYNERAKAFYRKYGFEEVKGSEYYYDVIPVVKMIRKEKSNEV